MFRLNGAILFFFFLFALLNDFSLCSVGLGVDLRVDPRMLTERIVVVHEFTTSLLIETRFGERDD